MTEKTYKLMPMNMPNPNSITPCDAHRQETICDDDASPLPPPPPEEVAPLENKNLAIPLNESVESEENQSPDMNTHAPLQLQISSEASDCDPPLDGWFEPMVRKALAAADVNEGCLGIHIVHDSRMAEMHWQYMEIEGTTDVLTFDMRDADDDPFEGDIIICIDEAARRAEPMTHDTRTEVLLYAVHGILHLLGYDDHELEDFREMHAREDEILQAMGIGKVFHLSPDDRPKGFDTNQPLDES